MICCFLHDLLLLVYVFFYLGILFYFLVRLAAFGICFAFLYMPQVASLSALLLLVGYALLLLVYAFGV